MRKGAISLISFFAALPVLLSAQTERDSLLALLSRHKKEDSVKASILAELAFVYTNINSDSALYYGEQGVALSKKLNCTEPYIDSRAAIGIAYRDISRTGEAIEVFNELITLRTKQKNEGRLIGCYSNLATVYLYRQEFAPAIKNFQKGLELARKLEDENRELMILGNMALTYRSMADDDKALEIFNQAIQLNHKLKDEISEANLLTNMGTIYKNKGNVDEAIKAYSRAQRIFQKLGYTRGYLDNAINLMNCYNTKNDYERVLKEAEEAGRICLQNQDSIYLADIFLCKSNALIGLGRTQEAYPLIGTVLEVGNRYTIHRLLCVGNLILSDLHKLSGKHQQAIDAALIAKVYADSLSDLLQLEDAYHTLYLLYSDKKDYKNAAESISKILALRDSFNVKDFNAKLANLKSLFELDLKEKDIHLLSMKNEISNEKVARQEHLIIAGSIGGVFLLGFLILSVRAYRIKKKDNVILGNQKAEIEFKNAILNDKNFEISSQKLMLEEKNKEILDSITYARRIQRALLASDTMLSQHLHDYFVFYKPKAIVSGDFYWATEIRKLKPGKMFQEKGSDVKGVSESADFIIVCGDCTGHGVPGAFMSLLNISKLNETINEKKVKVPGPVLDNVRSEIIAALNPPANTQEGDATNSAVQDGMDCALVKLNREEMTLTYAAANNPVYIVREGTLHICPADKMPVGKSPSESTPFSTYTVELKPGDMVYMMTDGFADQFGGPKGKKFKYKPLEELFKTISPLAASEQKDVLDKKFSEWIAWPGSSGALDQIDDVLIIGFRV